MDLPNPGIAPLSLVSAALAGGFFTTEPSGKPLNVYMLLLSHFSHVQFCVTPQMSAHQALLPLGFSRQEHWSGLPFPSPMPESEKVKVKLLSRV